MTAFIIYILKSTLCLSAFYLLYRLLFRGTTHFRFNRRVLLLGLLVCSLLPLVHFTLEEELPVHRSLRMLDEALTKVTLPQTRQAEVGAVVSADAGESTFLYSRFFFFLYVGGCSFVLLLFFGGIHPYVASDKKRFCISRKWCMLDSDGQAGKPL